MTNKIPNDRPDYMKSELIPSDRDVLCVRITVWLCAIALLAFYAFCCTRAYAGGVAPLSDLAESAKVAPESDLIILTAWVDGYTKGLTMQRSDVNRGDTVDAAAMNCLDRWNKLASDVPALFDLLKGKALRYGEPSLWYQVRWDEATMVLIYVDCMGGETT